jgi:hypothetical protein
MCKSVKLEIGPNHQPSDNWIGALAGLSIGIFVMEEVESSIFE